MMGVTEASSLYLEDQLAECFARLCQAGEDEFRVMVLGLDSQKPGHGLIQSLLKGPLQFPPNIVHRSSRQFTKKDNVVVSMFFSITPTYPL